MTIPSEILELVEQLADELDRIEQQRNEGLAIANQIVARLPNNARLICLSANHGNILFFVSSFRNCIDRITMRITGTKVSIKAIQEADEKLSEFWGRVLECKMLVNRSIDILEDLLSTSRK